MQSSCQTYIVRQFNFMRFCFQLKTMPTFEPKKKKKHHSHLMAITHFSMVISIDACAYHGTSVVCGWLKYWSRLQPSQANPHPFLFSFFFFSRMDTELKGIRMYIHVYIYMDACMDGCWWRKCVTPYQRNDDMYAHMFLLQRHEEGEGSQVFTSLGQCATQDPRRPVSI